MPPLRCRRMTAASLLSRPIRLPPPFAGRLDGMADALMTPPGMEVDFARPEGEAALVAADSVSWRVFKNPMALFIGGVAAVLLELAEPRVRAGVWQHSSFRSDALTRLQRTGLAAMVTVYGARSQAEAMIAGVVRAHDRVTGTTSEGLPYRANDPELLRWVQATATFGFLTAYGRFAHRLSRAEMDRGIAEAAPAARLYGVPDPPLSLDALEALFAEMDARLVPSPVIGEFLDIMARVEAFPAALRPLQRMMLKAAVSLLPGPLRARLGLGAWRLSRWERAIVTAAARAGDRLVLPKAPPAQACLRLGLPVDWLYRR
jgi:uncharacterized protein (DUF2236 family)